ncbi:hypothetical protein [Actinoallomurus rhizosphaericola]|uniref:hypothetical protein n=1 Tax=Actinoallomurus rhizosphaericola TaxID=2952536 RepID=UPI002092B5AD|nr:hypothetical protein [Actinoallomurus rhizosphaericola]MCO5996876.1 hypothetical protein [Actinoallomurus rhizosphaericola]
MTEAPHRAALMVRRLEGLAAELRRTYRVTVVVQEQRRPFPVLEAISARRRGFVLAGAVHYWWHGEAPWAIGPVTDVHGAARWIADRLDAVAR